MLRDSMLSARLPGRNLMMDRPHFQLTGRVFAGIALVTAITTFYYSVYTDVNSTTIALTFLLAILAIATRWGLIEAIVSSIAAMFCFNFFFLEPRLTLTIADPQNWVALFAFLITAAVASQLSASAKQRAMEAMRRQHEMERLYELSRALMLADKSFPIGSQLSQKVAQIFDLQGVTLFDRRQNEIYRTGSEDSPISESKLRDLTLQGTSFSDPGSRLSVLPLSLGGEPFGALALYGGSISDAAIHSIASLAAIVIERARVEEAASRLEAARQNEEMKSMLLDALAHEFKTPLTSIKAASSSILDQDRPVQKELVTIIDEETDRLDSLVSETIRMARIEAGDLQLHKSREEVRELVTMALQKLRIQLEDREIRIDVASDIPRVMVDAELAALTLRQLVTNALKYSNPESPITIRASAGNSVVKFSVRDAGPGIRRQELPRIFERYYRVLSNSEKIPGTGMGLAIARDIVRAHGGEIWAESESGEGSEFFFTLPAAEETENKL